MELRHIRYFLAVAEEGNFTRAAARIGIGQPPLSQQIKDLEAEIGTRLFRRVPHGAELTEAGHAFRASVRGIPGQASAAVHAARRAARGETGSLGIGFTGSATFNPIVPSAIRSYRRAFPDVELTLGEANSSGLAAGLRDGSLDAAFLRPGAVGGDDLQLHLLHEEPMLVALPGRHPLAGGDEADGIDLARLLDQSFILTPRFVGPTLFDAAVEACRAAGFEPMLGQSAPQMASVLALVAAELGVSIVPASMRQLGLNGVVYRPVAGQAPVARLAIAHRRGDPSMLVRNFVANARRTIGQGGE
ncbi:LysR family transcriptional regulator [Sphingomonas oleivorans]|uniref:LysR family transcriptional regulator n=1 Tax=Sphingomonas oleivorans TaxID=1735121 RepID=A0A2T5G0A8_9SPHN|nr:LysR family transcriptional regulator [Sphingomonas oleivorans]PTQ12393.1 LysR family transcriptional regulator [Sphingomonas oleivorans]